MQGRIIKQISNNYTVLINKVRYECSARGKFRNLGLSPVVGDIVEVNIDTLTIDAILSRKNKLNRPVVANVDIALIVTSVKKPDLSLTLLDKLITIIKVNKIEPVIILTKLDLLNKEELNDLKKLMNYYKKLGIKVLTNKHPILIKYVLKNKVVVFLSSIITSNNVPISTSRATEISYNV